MVLVCLVTYHLARQTDFVRYYMVACSREDSSENHRQPNNYDQVWTIISNTVINTKLEDRTRSCVDIALGNKGCLKECHVATNDVIMANSLWTYVQMIVNECAKFEVDLIDKSARIGYENWLLKIINIQQLIIKTIWRHNMTSLQVCHCRVIFYTPTKFHDDRSYMILMTSWWRHPHCTTECISIQHNKALTKRNLKIPCFVQQISRKEC